MITDEDVSVVVQGPIDWSLFGDTGRGTTQLLTNKLRRLLPGAEIVLSTWIGGLTDGIIADKVVKSKDPGAQSIWPSYTPNNVNRQIVSTVAGLRSATRSYVLKIRTDMILNDLNFIKEYQKLRPLDNPERDIFSYPIVANNISSRNSKAVLRKLPSHPLLFHPSDHITFGRIEDVKMLWDVPLQTPEDAMYFIDRTFPNRWRHGELSRITPEQHIFTSAIRKKVQFEMAHYAATSSKLAELNEYYMTTHFHFIPDREFSVSFPKYHTDHHFSFEWLRYPDRPELDLVQGNAGTANGNVAATAGRSVLAKKLARMWKKVGGLNRRT